MSSLREYNLFDRCCLKLDQTVRALLGTPKTTGKVYPAQSLEEDELTNEARQHAAGLMRVNHAGEVCAQALYHGQASVSRSTFIQEKMQEAAIEEGDHLLWCEKRLLELGSHTSYLNPLWYSGSFCIGIVAGILGDDWSLGFVAETEQQVIRHLNQHLAALPHEDARSHAILQQMQKDEATHRDEAIRSGARELPRVIKKMMALTSKIMVKTTYWI